MNIPFLSGEDIERRAEDFLEEHLSQRIIPVPIEEIIEVDLRMEILPIPGFKARFGIEGYISNDMETLFVDEQAMQKYPARYRFTIAHELGHCLLHREFIESEFPGNETTWKTRLLQRDPKLHARLEKQANLMAGALLVPREALAASWDDARRLVRQNNLDPDDLDSFGISHLAARIAHDFKVSGIVVEIALTRYGFLER